MIAKLRLLAALLALAAPALAAASEYHGQITFAGQPLPGATITATQGSKHFTTTSDAAGFFTFPDLPDGPAKLDIAMQCFTPLHADVTIAATTPSVRWDLTLLPLDQLIAQSKLTKLPPTPLPEAPKAVAAEKKPTSPDSPPPDLPRPPDSSDGLLINGSSSNAATSQFSLAPAFGNNRTGSKSLYTGGFGLILDNSALDARPYSLSGLESPKDSYNILTGTVTLGGPIRIPRILPRGPNFVVSYQWKRSSTAAIASGLVPTAAERTGDLSGILDATGKPIVILNPLTGQPFPGNIIPVSTAAKALLQLYPLPNLTGSSVYNYQIPVLNSTHQDAMESRLDKSLGRKDQLFGGISFQSTRSASTSLFGFVDTTDTLGLTSNINWTHRFSQHLFVNTGYRFSRLRLLTVPNFANRSNISGLDGITGNDQDPTDWGPPTLSLSSGFASLSDANSAFNRSRTDAFSASTNLYRGHHNITVGADLRKQQYNDFFQQNPRGAFTFTGAATAGTFNGLAAPGSDLADLLLGVPDTSTIAFGNADKYLRQTVVDAYATDDWRLMPILTINAGLRYEYGAPITELKNRLVNLDVAPNFTAASPVLASSPTGPLTGSHYPTSLIRPDYAGLAPLVGISWRPIPASTVVVRAGYGLYHDTSVYQGSALQLAQQSPLSTSLSVQNSATCPLTLAAGFNPCSTTTPDTFAVDPNFRVGFAQTWQLAVQRDLPGALQATLTYFGVKGSNGVQQFLPNTYALGATNPCPKCPSGFTYRTSGGESTRESGQLQLRRRLRAGFAASLLYTFSKSTDDDALLGGQGPLAAGATSASTTSASIAQNWLNLSAEHARSTFDQRHLLNLQAQYTSGQGLGGGDLLSGWRGKILKEWTVLTAITTGSGLPQTPIYFAAIPGAACTTCLRPSLTGSPLYAAPAGRHLNAAAYTAPLSGQFGTAGRDSIEGPTQFSLTASLARTFRPSKRFFLDARVDATNLLNHATFTGWITTINSSQFGTPAAANSMRSLQTTLRLRF